MLLRAAIVMLAALNLGTALWWATHAPPPPAPEAPLPAGVEPLQLADEARAAARPAASAAPAAPARALAGAAHCFRLGPFDGRAAAEAALARLRPLASQVAVHQPPGTRARGWRVYLPPFASAEEAEAAAARVARAGFSDYFVVREGAEANALALGRFGSEPSARRHAEALQAAGFAAIAEPLGGAAAGTLWVDVAAGATLDAAHAQALAGAARRQSLDCAGLRVAAG
ncbi:MAG TPA: SPOR domain-containing protein [Lysobacter sp.]|nr:SPOR domain-containing protein [Lysobacter sp.]